MLTVAPLPIIRAADSASTTLLAGTLRSPPGVAGGQATVDIDHLASDIFGRVGSKKTHRPDDVVSLAQTAKRNLVLRPKSPGWIVGQVARQERRLDDARTDSVDGDTITRPLHRQRTREGGNAA